MGYDAAGNQTSDGSFSYAYDGAGRLYTVTNTAEYTYFGGLRIKKVVGSTTTVTIYSGANPIAEYVNGALSKEYIYSGSALLATIAGSVVTYHNPDHLSDRAETDSLEACSAPTAISPSARPGTKPEPPTNGSSPAMPVTPANQIWITPASGITAAAWAGSAART